MCHVLKTKLLPGSVKVRVFVPQSSPPRLPINTQADCINGHISSCLTVSFLLFTFCSSPWHLERLGSHFWPHLCPSRTSATPHVRPLAGATVSSILSRATWPVWALFTIIFFVGVCVCARVFVAVCFAAESYINIFGWRESDVSVYYCQLSYFLSCTIYLVWARLCIIIIIIVWGCQRVFLSGPFWGVEFSFKLLSWFPRSV